MAGRTTVLRDERGDYTITAEEGAVTINGGEPVRVVPARDGSVLVGRNPRRLAWVRASGDVRWVFLDGAAYTFDVSKPGSRRGSARHHGTLAAPMPATVIRLQSASGDRVSRGDVLIVLEAMKMELPIRAPADGVVTAVNCRIGDLVQPGTALIEFDERPRDDVQD
jgi:acetyl/propionyl-CoA carboxylase alpha subunit